jgi:23S rRNA (cytosine1962-C5)-methyltransferase
MVTVRILSYDARTASCIAGILTRTMKLNLSQLIQQRSALLAERDAIRLSHHDAINGVTIDNYGGWLLLTDYRGQPGDLMPLAGAVINELAKLGRTIGGAVARSRPDNLSHARNPTSDSLTLLAGDPPPTSWNVRERGMVFEVSFTEAGFSTGLFLDMVDGRQWVRDHATGRDVLNLFSFTGPFSIAAAMAEARSVIEVDTSGKWLGWSQRNQQHNGVTDGTIRQRRNDAVAFVSRAEAEAFDLIICDPPSYARPKRGKRFTIREGYRDMARHFVRCLRPGGQLLACCNHAQTDRKQFRKWIPRELTVTDWLPMPPDFAGADYLKIAVAEKRG